MAVFDVPFMEQAAAGDAALPYSAQEIRALLDAAVPGEGIAGVGHLAVTPRAAGANWSVDVAPGVAVILGDSIANQGKYVARWTSTTNVPVPTAPGSGQRVHRVIARVYDKQHSGTVYGKAIELQQDTGSGTPALPESAIELALITVKAGDGAVNAASIGTARPPWAAGLPPRMAQWEFYGGEQALPTKTTALYAPAGVRNTVDVTIPSATQGRAVVKRPGRYLCTGGARIAGSGPGTNSERYLGFEQWRGGVRIRKRGNDGGQGVNWSLVHASHTFDCLPGDELRMVIYQSTGNTHLVDTGDDEIYFSGTLVSAGQ